MDNSLKGKTINLMLWSSVEKFGQQFIQIVVGIVLARLVPVEDYGLMGMLVIFTAISNVFIDSGFTHSLVRERTSNSDEFNTIFTTNVSIGIIIYMIFFLSAPLIANFFQQPRLLLISRIAFLAIPCNAMMITPVAKLSIALDNKSIAKMTLFAIATSSVLTLIIAFLGYGVWALVAQIVLFAAFRAMAAHYIVKMKPKLMFVKKHFRHHWKFGRNLMGTGLLNAVFNNIYVFVFGKFFSIKTTGYYNQSFKQTEAFNAMFISIFTNNAYNVLAKVNNDKERMTHITREFVKKVSLITIPIMIFLSFSGYNFILALLGEKWINAVPYFRILCAANIFTSMYFINYYALNARGLSKTTFKIELIKKALILISVVALFAFGELKMLLGFVVVNWLSYAIIAIRLNKEIKYKPLKQLQDIIPAIVIGLFIGVLCYIISSAKLLPLLELVIQISLALILYICSIRVCYKSIYKEIITFIKLRFNMIKKK